MKLSCVFLVALRQFSKMPSADIDGNQRDRSSHIDTVIVGRGWHLATVQIPQCADVCETMK